MPRVVRAFRESYPQVFLRLEERLGHELVEQLRNEHIDVAFIRTPVADPEGLVEITAGTGGAVHHETDRQAPNSEVAISDAYGVLVLTLRPDGWDWSFLETDGSEGDAGSGSCH